MSRQHSLLDSLDHYASVTPNAIAVEGARLRLGYQALHHEVQQLARTLREQEHRTLGLIMDNSPAWLVTDLAALSAAITLVPLPSFFSTEQLQHAIQDAGIEAVIGLHSSGLASHFTTTRLRPLGRVAGEHLWLAQLPPSRHRPPLGDIAKVTYTSGTTGTPKGVCLSRDNMEQVAASLKQALAVTAEDKHLCLLPLAVLLENIGGLYVPLLSGACCHLPGLASVGMLGAAGLDPAQMLKAIHQSGASSIILLPQMLQALVAAVATQGGKVPQTLRFIAVGGAPVAPRLLAQAAELGLPVYEGYGLSECASVVAVNRPGDNRPGSVGRPLPHIELTFDTDGEILLRGNRFHGYLNQPAPEGEWYATGDLGHLDHDGYLHLTGRKKHCFITSFGRNVAPEWVERELTLSPAIAQAVVFGEARPFNVALIVPSGTDQEVQSAIVQANQQLPDYAQVSAWLVADQPFSLDNGQFTATGRPRREAIRRAYGDRIDALYENHGEPPERSHHAIF
ncbi:MAG: AMP-binding protein [Pseudomonadota bacterium]